MSKVYAYIMKRRMPVLFVGSVIGLAAPFLWYKVGPFSLVGLIPFFLFIDSVNKQYDFRRAVVYVWGAGYISIAVVVGWLLWTYPEQWTPLSGPHAKVLLLAVHLIFSLMLSLQFILLAVLVRKLDAYDVRKIRTLVLFPLVWVACEMTRSLFVSVLLIGDGSSIGLLWNFGSIGLTITNTSLAYVSRISGLYGLSYVGVLINLCLLRILLGKVKVSLAVIVTVLSLGILLSKQMKPSSEMVVAYEDNPSNYAAVREESIHQYGIAPQVVTLPEYTDIAHVNTILDSRDRDTIFVYSKLVSEEKKRNQLVLQQDSKIIHSSDKIFLVPVGEYTPVAVHILGALFGQSDAVNLNTTNRGLERGGEKGSAVTRMIGAQACSSLIAPEIYRKLVKEGAVVLTNSANLDIFRKATTYHEQNKQFAQFIAVANARTFVQSAVAGESYIIDSQGKFYATENKAASVKVSQSDTLYTKFGEWFGFFSLGVTAIVLTVTTKKKKPSHEPIET